MSTDDCPESERENPSSPVSQSLREAKWIVLIWFISSVWTITYCWLYGYQSVGPEDLSTVFGMPSWVFWGVAAPWLTTMVVSVFFALWGIHDESVEHELVHEQSISDGVSRESVGGEEV